MVINKSGNLKDHILELNRKCEAIIGEISIIGAKHQLRKKEIRVKLNLYETCPMPALLYGLKAWGEIGKDEITKIEKVQGKALKGYSTCQYQYHTWLNNGNRYMAS